MIVIGPGNRDTATPAPQSLWRNRDYMSWWTGTAVSLTGTAISNVAFPMLVLFATGSVGRAGIIAAAERVGALFTKLWGGALADRVSRKAILLTGALVQAAIMGCVTFSVAGGHVAIPLLAGAALVAGSVTGVTSAAVVPALRRLVPGEQYAARSAQEQGSSMAAQLVGAPLAGLLFSVSRWFPFAADAVSFVFAALGAAFIRQPLGPERTEHRSRERLITDIKVGVRFVSRQPYLRFSSLWFSVINMVGSGFTLLFISVLVYRGAGPRTVGFVSAIVLLGGVAGAVLSGPAIRRFPARRVFLIAGWAVVGAITLVGFAPVPWEAGAATCLAVGVFVPLNAIGQAYAVRLVPDELSGRVMSVCTFGSQGLTWVGSLLAGFLADWLTPPGAVFVFAAIAVPLAVTAHMARALELFDTPVAEVREFWPDRSASKSSGGRASEPAGNAG